MRGEGGVVSLKSHLCAQKIISILLLVLFVVDMGYVQNAGVLAEVVF